MSEACHTGGCAGRVPAQSARQGLREGWRGPAVVLFLALGVFAAQAHAQRVREGAAPFRFVPRFAVTSHPFGSWFTECGGTWFDPVRDEVYVCDPKRNRISVFSREGFWRFTFGPGAGLEEPRSVAVGRGGEIFVLDASPGMVHRLNARGEAIGRVDLVEEGDETMPALANLATAPDGSLAVVSASPPWLRVFDADLVERFRLEGPFPGDVLAEPTDVAFDLQGNLLVTSRRGTAIQVFDAKGRQLEAWGHVGEGVGMTDFSFPTGIAADGDGRIYVLDGVRQDIRAYHRGGDLIGLAGGLGRGAGAVTYPIDLSVDPSTLRLFVSEKFGRRVQVFDVDQEPEAN